MKTPEGRQASSGVGTEQLYLFEPPPFSPIWPRRSTLAGRALALFLEGEALTHPDFQEHTGSWRLSEPVRALRHDYGWPVESNDIPCPTADHPDRVISRYFLPAQVLKKMRGTHD